MKYNVLKISEQQDLIQKSAEWFSSKWKIPKSAYLDSMQSASSGAP